MKRGSQSVKRRRSNFFAGQNGKLPAGSGDGSRFSRGEKSLIRFPSEFTRRGIRGGKGREKGRRVEAGISSFVSLRKEVRIHIFVGADLQRESEILQKLKRKRLNSFVKTLTLHLGIKKINLM